MPDPNPECAPDTPPDTDADTGADTDTDADADSGVVANRVADGQGHGRANPDRLPALAAAEECWPAFDTPHAFAAYYRVDPTLLPWPHREFDLVEAGQTLADVVADLPPTVRGVTLGDVAAASSQFESAQGAQHIPLALFLVHGLFPLPRQSDATPITYLNPNWVHRHTSTNIDRVVTPTARRRWLLQYLLTGVADIEPPTCQFGLAVQTDDRGDPVDRAAVHDAVVATAADCGLNWDVWRVIGDAHIGRVWAFTLAWTDHTAAAVAQAYATTEQVVATLVSETLRNGVVVPRDPAALSRWARPTDGASDPGAGDGGDGAGGGGAMPPFED